MATEKDDEAKISVEMSGFDPWGIKAATEVSKEVVKFGLDSAKVFLNLTCRPLLEELGLGMRDKYANWRLVNIIKMLEKAEGKLIYDAETAQLKIDPRVAFQIVENVSTISDDNLQEMWAGLFAASCQTYEEDENIFFTDILKRLTSAQVKFLNHLCATCEKRIDVARLPESRLDGDISLLSLTMSYQDLLTKMETQSRLKVDSEFAQLESMGLIQLHMGGQNTAITLMQNLKQKPSFQIRATTTAIRLFVKCQGSSQTPFEYFSNDLITYYYEILSRHQHIAKNEVLPFLEQVITKSAGYSISEGNTSDKQRKYNIKLEDKKLSVDEVTEIIRSLIIRRGLSDIDRVSLVAINDTPLGNFKYKDGFSSFYAGYQHLIKSGTME